MKIMKIFSIVALTALISCWIQERPTLRNPLLRQQHPGKRLHRESTDFC